MKCTEENMVAVLDRLVERPSITGAAAVIGASGKLLFCWMRNSYIDKQKFEVGEIVESKWRIRWPDEDGEPEFFHDSVRLAQRLYAIEADAQNREMLVHGTKRLVMNGPMPCFEVDDKALAEWGDDKEGAKRIGGYFDYPYLHNSDGSRIRLFATEHVPSQTRIHTLRAIAGGVYDLVDRQSTEVQVGGGVLVLHGNAQQKRPDTPIVRDMEAKLAEIRARGPQNPKPDAPVAIGKPSDEPKALPPPEPKTLADHPRVYTAPRPPEPKPQSYARPQPPQSVADYSGVGRGAPLPGGFKVR